MSRDIQKFLEAIHSDSSFEIRVLGIPGKNDSKWTKFGYYKDIDKATKDIKSIATQKPEGIYVTVNPVSDEVVARSYEKLSSGRNTTQDGEITRRKHLFLDIDAGQPSGVCSTDAERMNAHKLLLHVIEVMRSYGWYERVKGSSGNGMYLLYEIDLPNDEASTILLSKVLKRIGELTKGDFGTAHIDTTVYNAARIMRVLGTWNCKGDSVGERIHRQSEFSVQPIYEVVTQEQLESLLPVKQSQDNNVWCPEFDVIDDDQAIEEAKAACRAIEPKWGNDGSTYLLSLCRTCKGKGVLRERAVKIVKDILETHPTFPRKYSDEEIAKRYDNAKIESGELLKPPPVITNYEIDEKRTIPKDLTEILADFDRVRLDLVMCRGKLHLIDPSDEEDKPPKVYILDRPEQLFAAVLKKTRVVWGQGITKAEFFESVKMRATEVESIELTPHFPPLPNYRYLCRIPKKATTELDRLLAAIRPHTEQDRDLLRAAICTMSWGGKPGRRPGFAIISSEKTRGSQIGSGKSSICSLCLQPYGNGQVLQHQIRASRDCDTLVKHLVSPGKVGARAIVLDNVKGRIEGQDIESLMTSPMISGHAMYAGYGTVANYYTWWANGNDLKLSDDVAKRLMPILIDKASYGPEWDATVSSINWLDVLSGVATILDRPAREMRDYTRWALWESEVMSKCTDDPDALSALIRERQSGLSATHEMAAELIDAIDQYVAEQGEYLKKYDNGDVAINGSELAQAFTSSTGEKWSPKRIKTELDQLNWLNGRISAHRFKDFRGYIYSPTGDTLGDTSESQVSPVTNVSSDELF